MIRQEFTIQDIKQAYRKLKHYFYYDNSNLLIRRQIAVFENASDFEERLTNLSTALTRYSIGRRITDFLKKRLEEIDYRVLPKSFSSPENNVSNDGSSFFSNITFQKEIVIEDEMYFIHAPIEIHIISVLWIMREGFRLEDELIEVSHPYGYKLETKGKGGGIVDGLKLFKPYFREYQAWRDGAITKAKEEINSGINVAIIGLDVKSYFESVQLDFKSLKLKLKALQNDNDLPLTNIIEKVHQLYFIKRRGKTSRATKRTAEEGLPIGLLSSGLLSNWCLHEMDKKVKEELNPVYYGRYVDDILIVLANPKLDKLKGNGFKTELFEEYLVRRGGVLKEIVKKKNDSKENKEYSILDSTLKIQSKKVSLMYFDAKEPITLLEKFESELRKNSSEFRFLPEEEPFEAEFENAAHSIVYSGSRLKLRSIRDFMNDKFGASKFLAKRIYSSLQADWVRDKKTRKQINTYFKGQRLLEYFQLWEKVVTYFIITEDQAGLERFLKNLKQALDNLTVMASNRVLSLEENRIKSSLGEYAAVAISMGLSLDMALNKKIEHLIKEVAIDPALFNYNIEKLPHAIRRSNMMRHSYVYHPLLNFTEYSMIEEVSLVHKDLKLPKSKGQNEVGSFQIDNQAFEYPPRFVHFHETVIFEVVKCLGNFKEGKTIRKNELRCSHLDDYLENSFHLFYGLNYSRRQIKNADKKTKKFKAIKEEYLPEIPDENKINPKEGFTIKRLDAHKDVKKEKLKVGLVNIQVHHANMKQSYLRNPIISKARRNEINDLLNQVSRESYEGKIDMVVLPETCIPYKWLGWISEHARKNELLTVFGLEHWIVNNIAYNFNVALLPIKVSSEGAGVEDKKTFNAIIPVIRLKNHYSPGEIKELRGYRFNIPVPELSYDLICWRGLNFAIFNCFELADITHRAAFRSKVDFLVACEFNRDINYFSNVVEAVTRDVHCYFIQSNNSQFGDNRITKPSRTEEKDIIKIKGGKNTTILVETIDIKRLRDFQLKEYELQEEDNFFKPTPPGFDVKEVAKRAGINLND